MRFSHASMRYRLLDRKQSGGAALVMGATCNESAALEKLNHFRPSFNSGNIPRAAAACSPASRV